MPEAGSVQDRQTRVRRHRARRPRPTRAAAVAGVVIIALGLACGWLGSRVYRAHQADATRALFLEAGERGAVNLTSIDHQRAEADVQRILDSATGAFRDDFVTRSVPLMNVVKKTRSTSVGTVTAAGVESMTAEQGQVLVALSVRTTNVGVPEQQPPRFWRMRLTVERIGDDAKISKVDFVP